MSTPVTTAPRQRLLLVAFGLVAAVVLIAIAEGILAFAGLGDPDERYADPYVGFDASTSLFVRSDVDGRSVFTTRPEKLRFFNHQSFAAEKAPDTYRVFTLGGSTVAGRPYDDRVAFGSWLERWLDQAEPDRRHEVVNAGAISYASYRVARLMEELVDYQPDLFVVLTGHNEFLEERTYRELRAETTTRQTLRSGLARLRLARLAWAALDDPAGDAEARPATVLSDDVETRLDVWTGLQAYERDDTLRNGVIEHFELNLRRMIALAREHDIDLVLVTPASNLRDFSPFKSSRGSALDDEQAARADRLLDDGLAHLAAERPSEAVTTLREASALDPDHAETWYRLGHALLAVEATDDARRALEQARETDIAPLRAIRPLVDAVRRIASERDVPLIDLPPIFAAESRRRGGDGIPGDDLFLDHVHPTIEMHALIAEEILLDLAASGRVATVGDADARRATLDAVVASLDHTYHARRDLNLAKVLGWAGKLEEAEAPLLRAREHLDGDGDFHLTLGTLWQKTGRLDDAATELAAAIRLMPDHPEAHFNLGVVLGRLGHSDDAITILERAKLLRDGNYPEAEYNLAMLHRSAGRFPQAILGFFDLLEAVDDPRRRAEIRVELAIALAQDNRFDEAVEQIDTALVEAPDSVDAHYARGRLTAATGRRDEAVDAYRRALDVDPDHVLTLNNLALLVAGQGQFDAAREYLERAIAAEPSSADAFLNLGVVHDQSGRPAEAVRAVERAAALRPADARIRLALGLLYFANQQRQEARGELLAARDLGATLPPDIARELQLPPNPSAGP
ncbi:MAG: tetratricopeptide repeat protein [Acidobacteriota bacterium]